MKPQTEDNKKELKTKTEEQKRSDLSASPLRQSQKKRQHTPYVHTMAQAHGENGIFRSLANNLET